MNWYEQIIEIADTALTVLLGYWMFSAFWEKKKRPLIHVAVFGVLCAAYLWLFFSTDKKLFAELTACLPLLGATLLFCGRPWQKGLFPLLFLSAVFASEIMVEVVGEHMHIFQAQYTMEGHLVQLAFSLLLSKSFVFTVVAAIRVRQVSNRFAGAKKYYFFVPIFLILSIAILILQFYVFPDFHLEDQTLLIVVAICFTVLVASSILMFVFIDLQKTNFESESRLLAAEELIVQQAAGYRALEEHHRDVIRIRHDQHNFYIGLLNALQRGNTEEAVSALEKECALLKSKPYGDIVHTVVEVKRKEAEAAGITIDLEYRAQEKLAIPSVDLAVILGNALDNAIEACAGLQDKTVRLLVALQNSNIVILVKNPVDKKVDVEKLATGKRDTAYHGFGILSMRQLAAKHGGEVVLSCTDDTFTTSVVLNNLKG